MAEQSTGVGLYEDDVRNVFLRLGGSNSIYQKNPFLNSACSFAEDAEALAKNEEQFRLNWPQEHVLDWPAFWEERLDQRNRTVRLIATWQDGNIILHLKEELIRGAGKHYLHLSGPS